MKGERWERQKSWEAGGKKRLEKKKTGINEVNVFTHRKCKNVRKKKIYIFFYLKDKDTITIMVFVSQKIRT